jgi:hypothetical protein
MWKGWVAFGAAVMVFVGAAAYALTSPGVGMIMFGLHGAYSFDCSGGDPYDPNTTFSSRITFHLFALHPYQIGATTNKDHPGQPKTITWLIKDARYKTSVSWPEILVHTIQLRLVLVDSTLPTTPMSARVGDSVEIIWQSMGGGDIRQMYAYNIDQKVLLTKDGEIIPPAEGSIPERHLQSAVFHRCE